MPARRPPRLCKRSLGAAFCIWYISDRSRGDTAVNYSSDTPRTRQLHLEDLEFRDEAQV